MGNRLAKGFMLISSSESESEEEDDEANIISMSENFQFESREELIEDIKNKLSKKIENYQLDNTNLDQSDNFDIERAVIIYNLLGIEPLPLDVKKNEFLSGLLRKEGNKLMKDNFDSKKERTAIFELFTKSILQAPQESNDLIFSLNDRSIFFKQIGLFEECISDINYALSFNCPENLKTELMHRKFDCLRLTQNNDLLRLLKTENLSLKTISSNEKLKIDLLKKLQKSEIKNKSDIGSKNLKKSPNFDYQERIPCASKLISVDYNTKYGRHVIANETIKTGQILIKEKPFASLLYHNSYDHCWYCLKITLANIPCHNCSYTVYCSENCRTKAWRNYHEVECSAMSAIFTCNMSQIFTMRLVILIIKKAGGIDKLKKESQLHIHDNKKVFFENGVFQSDSYKTLLNYVPNKTDLNRVKSSLPGLMFLLYYLCTQSLLFEKELNSDLLELVSNEDVLFVGKLMLRIFCAVAKYSYGIYESVNHKEQINLTLVGVTFAPFCSLVNHSCYPNVERCFTDDGHLIVYSIHPIMKNSQLFISYGYTFEEESKSERQMQLEEKYNFHCECQACLKNWPEYENLPQLSTLIPKSNIIVERKLKDLKKYIDYTVMDYEKDKTILNNIILFIETMNKYNNPYPTSEFLQSIGILNVVFHVIYGKWKIDLQSY